MSIQDFILRVIVEPQYIDLLSILICVAELTLRLTQMNADPFTQQCYLNLQTILYIFYSVDTI